MRHTHLFTKTRKDAPKDEVSKNAELLIRAGYIHKEFSGVYSLLPLGLRVVRKITDIIREEMDELGAQEVHLTALQEKEKWEKTGRWSDAVVDNWFKTRLKNESELGLAFSHEEALTTMLTNYITSYRDLPKSVYQFQTKFRNELRAKSGIMRAREFLMKDLYSFSRTDADHGVFYSEVKDTYVHIFERLGIGDRTYVTFASGGTFAPFSHEFQTITDAGEDIIYVDEKKKIAVNKEVYTDDILATLGLKKEELVEKKAVEVGNIFSLGAKFSEPLGLLFTDEDGTKKPVMMGSYGIGIGRVMGAVVEALADEHGIVWPAAIAPYKVHLVALFDKDGKVERYATELYDRLVAQGVEVLYDDRDARAGEKFADADLIGIPLRLIVSEKLVESKQVELKVRTTGETTIIPHDDISEKIKNMAV